MALIMAEETVPSSMAVEVLTLTVTSFSEMPVSHKYGLVSLKGFDFIIIV